MIIDGAILAAGFGTRMASPVSKMESVVLGDPLISYPWRALLSLGEILRTIYIVSRPEGFSKDLGLRSPSGQTPSVVVQPAMDGTWGAVEAVVLSEGFQSGKATHLLVVNGDGPLVDGTLLLAFVSEGKSFPESLLIATADLQNPQGYGRVVRNPSGAISDIREESRATADEKKIREVNAGIYLIPRSMLEGSAAKIPFDPVKKERFLTALIGRIVADGGDVRSFSVDPECMLGVNTQEDLAQVTRLLRSRINRAHMMRGVTIWDPERTDIGPEVRIGPGTVIMPQTVLEGKTEVGASCRIGLGVHLLDTVIGDQVTIRDYVVSTRAHCRKGSVIGPFAHLRPETDLGEEAHLGNFVETKKAAIGPGAKVNHLSYIGDAQVGSKTNIGAGTITCNYDGYGKYRTMIGADVFIGSDTQLVAPVSVGDRAVIGAGSTIVADVPDDALVLSRSPQENRPAGGTRYHKRRRDSQKGKKQG
jgi:bifunctional UDP-N-acetylglucosamine pyrophosphorylase/glucosamine-1-phosphate N-acetyltransferase